MSQTAADQIVNEEQTESAEQTENQGEVLDSTGEEAQANEAQAAPPPARAQRQVQRNEPPAYQTPERLLRAREQFKTIDADLGTGGKLSGAINELIETTDEFARENATLRHQLQQQGKAINGMGFWQQHDSDPQNAAYPSSQAKQDYQDIMDEVAADPNYVGVDEKGLAIAARERFFANLPRHRADAAANNTTDAAGQDTGQQAQHQTQQTQQATQQPRQVVKTVGSTRVIPRSTRNTAPPPQRRMTVTEMLERDAMPADVRARVEQEFRDMES